MLIKPLILAAGMGTRFDKPKVFCSYQGKYFIEMICESLSHHYLKPLVVIRKCFESDFRKTFPLIDEIVINENADKGMFSSVICGTNKITDTNICIIPVDHPFVSFNTYVKLAEFSEIHNNKIIKPVFNNERGHPVIIPQILKQYFSNDVKTLKELTSLNHVKTFFVEVYDKGILKNINKKEDLQ